MRLPIGQILLKEGAITRHQLEEAIQAQIIYGGKLGTILVELGFISIATLNKALAKELNLPLLSNSLLKNITKEALKLVDKPLAHKYCCIPLSIEGSKLKVVMEDPTDLSAIDELGFITGKRITPYIAPELLIVALMEKYYDFEPEARFVKISLDEGKKLNTAQKKSGYGKKLPAITTPFPPLEKERPQQIPPPDSESVNDETFQDDLLALEELVYDIPTIDISKAIDPEEILEDAELEEEIIEELPEAISLQEAIARLDKVKNRDELSQIVLSFSLSYFKRAALFITRFETAIGWDGMGRNINKQAIQSTMLPLKTPSILKTIYDTQAFFLGSIPKSPINDRFIKLMGGEKPDSVFLIPILFNGDVVNILYGDNGEGEKAPFDISELLILAPKVPMAFEKLIKDKKEEIIPGH